MSVTLAEEYSDNFSFRSQEDRGEDYRTSVRIGTVYRLESGKSFVSLANTISANYAVRSEESNFGFANVSLNAGHQLPRLALTLSESLVRSDEISEASPSGLRRGRRNFLRNSVSPQMRYTFSRLTSMDLAYTNTVVFNDDIDQDNSITHSATTSLRHQLSRVLAAAITYGFSTGASQGGAADTEAHNIAATLGYAPERRMGVTLQAFSRLTDRSNGGTDSQLYGVSVGIRRQLTSFLSAFASIGPTLLDREGQDQRVFVNWQASLDGALPISRRMSLTLASQQGISDTLGQVNNVGIVLNQSVSLGLHYIVSRGLLTSLFATYGRTELLEEDVRTSESVRGREDNFWRAGISASYTLTRTVVLSAGYTHQRRESNLAGADFDENRVTLTLSSSFSVF
jgi:hypothetical protein